METNRKLLWAILSVLVVIVIAIGGWLYYTTFGGGSPAVRWQEAANRAAKIKQESTDQYIKDHPELTPEEKEELLSRARIFLGSPRD